jgi:T5SS/PEP-CTERM-associated repeat protein
MITGPRYWKRAASAGENVIVTAPPIARLQQPAESLVFLLLLPPLLTLMAAAAQAGFSETGTNSPEPVVSGTTNDYFIGNGAAGSLTINDGASFTAGGLDAGDEGTGNGTITIDGTGTTVTFNPVGEINVLQPGNWGTGSVTIFGGAVVNGMNTANCATGWCNSFVANGAGSTGTLNITGAGSSLSLPNVFVVGSDVVDQNTTTGYVFGTPGGASSATLNITAGGTLNTQTGTIGQNGNMFTPPAGEVYADTGTESVNAVGKVDGAGSAWNVTSVANTTFEIGLGSNATGSLSVTNGGAVNLVNGSGSTSTSLVLEVGHNGGSGSIVIDGVGSSMTLSGPSASNGADFGVGAVDTPSEAATLGPTTTGSITVQHGGSLTLDTVDNTHNGMAVGRNGGTGTVTVTGAGSLLQVLSTDNGSGTEGGATIGRSGNGTLNVLAGGQFNINDTGTAAGGGLQIGGSNLQISNGEQPGTGIVTVSGTGSQLNVQSAHGFIDDGYTGTGTLNVSSGGAVTAEGLAIAFYAGSTGSLSLNGRSSSVTLAGSDSPTGNGARIQVGAGGIGDAFITNGAELLINPTNPNGGIYIGGTGTEAGGVGTMTVSGGSQVLVSGTGNNLVVGRNGTGTLTITGPSAVNVASGAGSTGQTFVGAIPTSFTSTSPLSGSIVVANGATLDAGSLLGVASNGVDNGPGPGSAGSSNVGTGSVLMTGNSTINATNVVIGENGTFGGNGTVNGNVTNNGGILDVGASPDALDVNGNYTQTGGTINLEVEPDGQGGFLTDTLVLQPGSTISVAGATINFNFLDGANPATFAADGLFNLDTFFRFENASGTGDVPLSADLTGPLDTIFTDDTYMATADAFDVNSFAFDPDVGVTELAVTAVPEPGSLWLWAAAFPGLAGLLCLSRRLASG